MDNKNMANDELVRRFCTAFEAGDETSLKGLLADNFQAYIPGREQPANKAEFVQVVSAIKKGIPDIKLNLEAIQAGNPCTAQVQLQGTHRGTLDLTAVGLPRVEATNRHVKLPQESASWRIENGRITEHRVEPVPGGGIAGLLAQVGASPEIKH